MEFIILGAPQSCDVSRVSVSEWAEYLTDSNATYFGTAGDCSVRITKDLLLSYSSAI